jgi:hypothetical protein
MGSLYGNYRILILILVVSFSPPVLGLETKNLLFQTDIPCMECGPEERSSLPGLIQKVNRFENPVEFVDRRKNPVYDSIGVVISGSKYGTAFLFASPCYILTNFHVAFGARYYRKLILNEKNVDMSNETLAKERVVFKVGVTSDPNKFRDEVEATPVIWGDFPKSFNPEDDWALLKLDKCLEHYERLSVPRSNPDGVASAIKQGVKPAVLGYYNDISQTQLHGAFNCKQFMKMPSEMIMRTDCSTTQGASGGPVLLIKDGKSFVIGINSGTSYKEQGTVPDADFSLLTSNQVVPMYYVLPKLEDYFAAHPPRK